MPVIQLTSDLLKPFGKFAEEFEYKSISFINRICKDGKLFVPPLSSAKIICEVQDEKPAVIKNAIMVTMGGIVLPLFSHIQPDRSTLEKMLEQVTEYKDSLFCILGVTKDTLQVKRVLNFSQSLKTEYVLLLKSMGKRYRMDKALFKTKRAGKKDASILFGLEKEYLLEEVLLDRSELNQRAAMLNLRKTCSSQIVYYATAGSEVIAKVNTNGLGIYYNQIGGVFTRQEFRERGISTYLMKILLNEIYLSGKNAVLYVKKENTAAVSLYKKLGFIKVDDYQAIYAKP